MEPVKKSEAPDYYEIIRFPIGQYPLLFLKIKIRFLGGPFRSSFF